MIYDPKIEVPQEIMDAAMKVDVWAKQHGWEEYAIGPVRNRFGKSSYAEIDGIKARLRRIEHFLSL